MRMRYRLFLDRRQILSLLFAAFSGWLTVEEWKTQDLWWIFWGLVALTCAALALGLPCFYVMTSKGLHLIHALGLIRRFIPWDTVVGLEVKYDTGCKRLPYLFDTFLIYGDARGPTFFFTEDEMPRTLRARLLLEKYTGLRVEGFLLDSIRDVRREKKEKKEQERRRRERQERVEKNRKVREAKKKARTSKGKKP